MILVLADDFSGAAEMAGIAHFLGCSAEIQTSPRSSFSSEVVAIDTHTRGLSKSDAVAKLDAMIPMIKSMRADWVFKKVDSVLRGHVLAESAVLMHGLDLANGVLVSANPSKNRVIRGGEYFIDDTPLHQTVFARDPVFPATTANVMELLGPSETLDVLRYRDGMKVKEQQGLLVPDVSSQKEVSDWAGRMALDSLAVGGVDFFSSLIQKRYQHNAAQRGTQQEKVSKTRLLICGSYAAMDSGRLEQCHQHGWTVHLLPERWMTHRDTESLKCWCDHVWNDMQHAGKCMVGIDVKHVNTMSDPSHPARRLIEAVHLLCRNRLIDQILVEGGETAFLLVCSYHQDRFKVEQSSREGIPELVPWGEPSPRIVPKPGSYPWPDEFLDA